MPFALLWRVPLLSCGTCTSAAAFRLVSGFHEHPTRRGCSRMWAPHAHESPGAGRLPWVEHLFLLVPGCGGAFRAVSPGLTGPFTGPETR